MPVPEGIISTSTGPAEATPAVVEEVVEEAEDVVDAIQED